MCMGKPFIAQGVYHLQYKCLYPATRVTLAATVDIALGLNVYMSFAWT